MSETYDHFRKRLSEMDKGKASAELGNLLYEASAMVEVLEGLGKIFGNGHHVRQRIAKFGTDMLEAQWNEKEPK